LTVNGISRISERMTKEQVVALLESECVKAGSQAAWARKYQVSPAYLSDVLAGRREPGGKLLDALGLERLVSYERRLALERAEAKAAPALRRPRAKAKAKAPAAPATLRAIRRRA
jgi:hypothetical protein